MGGRNNSHDLLCAVVSRRWLSRWEPWVLSPEAEADESADKARQRRETRQAHEEPSALGRRSRTIADRRSESSILDEELETLGHARRPLASALDALEVIVDGSVGQKWGRQDVGCRDGILDRQVDAYSADR
jgi:hypothetical protein